MEDSKQLIEEAKIKINERKFNESKALVKKLLSQNYNNFEALSLMGLILGLENEYKESISFFKSALQIKPQDVSANFNLACSLSNIDKDEESLKYHKIAYKFAPNNSNILLNYGKSLFKLGQNKEALSIFSQGLTINPNSFEFNYNIGLIHKALFNFNLALDFFNRCSQLSISNSMIFYQRGKVLMKLNHFDSAIQSFQKALDLGHKKTIEIHNNISFCLINNYDHKNSFKNKDSKKILILAEDFSKKVISQDPENNDALTNLGLCNLYQFNINLAIQYFEKVKTNNPSLPDNYNNLSLAYRYAEDYINAEKNYKKSISLQKKNDESLALLAEVQLRMNNFHEGWDNYESRYWNLHKINSYNFSKPIWDSSMGYEKILIWGEQGMGDKVLFSTILPDIYKKFKKIILLTDKRLFRIYKENFPNISFYDQYNDKVDEKNFDYHISLSSLGRHFRKNIQSFSIHTKLDINSDKFKKTDNSKLRCGLSWKSYSPTGNIKSLELELLKDILDIKNIDFFNIQYSDEENEVKSLKNKFNLDIHNIENIDTKNDIYGLMQFMKSCDFIITISNTNAHLAGSLGIPTYLLLPKGVGAIWYWMNEFEGKNLWYPSIKKIQQLEYNGWPEVINRLNEILKNDFKDFF